MGPEEKLDWVVGELRVSGLLKRKAVVRACEGGLVESRWSPDGRIEFDVAGAICFCFAVSFAHTNFMISSTTRRNLKAEKKGNKKTRHRKRETSTSSS